MQRWLNACSENYGCFYFTEVFTEIIYIYTYIMFYSTLSLCKIFLFHGMRPKLDG